MFPCPHTPWLHAVHHDICPPSLWCQLQWKVSQKQSHSTLEGLAILQLQTVRHGGQSAKGQLSFATYARPRTCGQVLSWSSCIPLYWPTIQILSAIEGVLWFTCLYLARAAWWLFECSNASWNLASTTETKGKGKLQMCWEMLRVLNCGLTSWIRFVVLVRQSVLTHVVASFVQIRVQPWCQSFAARPLFCGGTV